MADLEESWERYAWEVTIGLAETEVTLGYYKELGRGTGEDSKGQGREEKRRIKSEVFVEQSVNCWACGSEG